MDIINTDYEINDYEYKKKVYELYYYILEQIKGQKMNKDKKEIESEILSIDISTIIHYIKESIPILINNKIEEFIIKQKDDKNVSNKDNNLKNQMLLYENQLRNLESQLRYYICKQLQYKIQKESYESKIRNYLQIENEYEILKQKVKYDGKNFLNNDRKENEIEILRRENSNLKKAISKFEEEKKITDSKREISQKTILSLKNQIEKLNNKLFKVEKELIEIKENANSSINININNGKSSSNWIINQNFIPKNRNKINLKNQNNTMSFNDIKPPINNNNRNEKKIYNNTLIDNQKFTNTYNKILNGISSKTSSNKKSIKHSRNNSINNIEEIKKAGIISKYLSHRNYNTNYVNNLKYSNISNGISSSRNLNLKDKNKSKTSSINTIYNNNHTKINRSGNRSTVNIRSTSNEK